MESIEQAFARAVYFANNRQEYSAYIIFRNLSRLPVSNQVPDVWLWLARLSPDYNEAEHALSKVAELGPEDYHLAKVQAGFAQRWERRNFLSLAGLVVALALLPFTLFTIYNLFVLPRLFSDGYTVFYPRPFIDNKVSIIVLALFPILITAGTFLYCTMKVNQRVTFWNFFNFNFLWVVFAAGCFLAYFILPALTWSNQGYSYIGRTSSGTSGQVFHLEIETSYPSIFQTKTDFKVYKCDSSGLFCKQFKKISDSSKPVQFPLEKNNFKLQVNDTKRELYILFDTAYTPVHKNVVWETIKF